MVDAFGSNRVTVKPPERGVFPLDHDGECKEKMNEFMKCLKQNKNDHFPCKPFSKAYLQCRMDRNLMSKEDLNKLGLDENSSYERKINPSEVDSKESKGFISGLGVRGSNKWGWL